jgi:hypothetical protein
MNNTNINDNETNAENAKNVIEQIQNELPNALVNMGTIPRSLIKKLAKNFADLAIWNENGFLDMGPFSPLHTSLFPKVHLHPIDIAYGVDLMSKFQHFDPTTVRSSPHLSLPQFNHIHPHKYNLSLILS